MNLSESPLFHDKSKHIKIKYHYIRDMVQIGAVNLQYVATDKQITDVLTTGDSLVDQYPITLVHIVGFKIIKN